MYGSANQRASSVKARGTEAAMTKAAAVAASVTTRTRSCEVSAGLRVHVNWVHAHQMSQPTMTDRSTPSALR